MKKINMYGLNKSVVEGLKQYKITLITKKFELIISSIPFFRDLGGSERVTKGYTVAGYIPVELSSISPNRETKIVRSFKVER